ncbi:MAG: YeiH family protein [Sulfurimonas sp.]|uniref:YeiH family protein n=1 Tax=Sulfurimonas sp. TaxID=2022749 RepID=UPI00261B8A92|nr:YeiH family protein [Sulfurimonas sp.]MDD2653238.1 YeiH family protein [Sulfurimonas sp.]MDD3452299.1 YeiH family protein [Sulfurimonas sp.]
MPFSPTNRKGTVNGVIFVAIFAAAATMISEIAFVKSLGISPLVIGIVIGIFYANTLHNNTPKAWSGGITFSAKKILRFAIVFYGFRITFQQIAEVGAEGFLVSLIMLSTTFILGTWAGQRFFKMDRDTAMLSASGASVCGAAAVLATEPVLKAEEHKAAIAVSMVVLFGTIAMFLYPALYNMGIFDMSAKEFGIYVGGTIHEVAQVVAVPASIPGASEEMANSAVIVKMTRVIMIAPMLILLGIYLSMSAKKSGGEAGGVKLVIPWFAVYFIGMAGFNSLGIVPQNIVALINQIDTFLLTMAMTALGIGTVFSKFKGLGLAPIYAAGTMFAWLVVGGYFITKWVVATF